MCGEIYWSAAPRCDERGRRDIPQSATSASPKPSRAKLASADVSRPARGLRSQQQRIPAVLVTPAGGYEPAP